jgi:hypothetical protein
MKAATKSKKEETRNERCENGKKEVIREFKIGRWKR